jgi:hypothetical protein
MVGLVEPPREGVALLVGLVHDEFEIAKVGEPRQFQLPCHFEKDPTARMGEYVSDRGRQLDNHERGLHIRCVGQECNSTNGKRAWHLDFLDQYLDVLDQCLGQRHDERTMIWNDAGDDEYGPVRWRLLSLFRLVTGNADFSTTVKKRPSEELCAKQRRRKQTPDVEFTIVLQHLHRRVSFFQNDRFRHSSGDHESPVNAYKVCTGVREPIGRYEGNTTMKMIVDCCCETSEGFLLKQF